MSVFSVKKNASTIKQRTTAPKIQTSVLPFFKPATPVISFLDIVVSGTLYVLNFTKLTCNEYFL